jgi:hypothetical protein
VPCSLLGCDAPNPRLRAPDPHKTRVVTPQATAQTRLAFDNPSCCHRVDPSRLAFCRKATIPASPRPLATRGPPGLATARRCGRSRPASGSGTRAPAPEACAGRPLALRSHAPAPNHPSRPSRARPRAPGKFQVLTPLPNPYPPQKNALHAILGATFRRPCYPRRVSAIFRIFN